MFACGKCTWYPGGVVGTLVVGQVVWYQWYVTDRDLDLNGPDTRILNHT